MDGPLLHMTGVLVRRENSGHQEETQAEHHTKIEAEIRVTLL